MNEVEETSGSHFRSSIERKSLNHLASQAYAKAVSSYQEGNLSQALRYYEEALTIDEHHIGATIGLSILHRETGKADVAVIYGQRAVASQPDLAEAHDALGTAFLSAGDLFAAIQHLRTALAISPESAGAYAWRFKLGHALMTWGRYDEAAAVLRRVNISAPSFAPAFLYRGFALHYVGRDGEANDAFATATYLDPSLSKQIDDVRSRSA